MRELRDTRETIGRIPKPSSGSSFTPYRGESVVQSSHGFIPGNVVQKSGGTWVKAIATSELIDDNVGVVYTAADADNFLVVTSGSVKISGMPALTPGPYFISPTDAGEYVEESVIDSAVEAYKADLLSSQVYSDIIVIVGPSADPAFKRGIFEYQSDSYIEVYGPELAGTHPHSLGDLIDVYTTSGDASAGGLTAGDVLKYNGEIFTPVHSYDISAGLGLVGDPYNGTRARSWHVDESRYYTKAEVDALAIGGSVTLATLTPGDGLLGTPYDGTTNQTFDVDYSVVFTGTDNGFVPFPPSTAGDTVLADDGSWISVLTNPMTAIGDMIVGDTGGAPIRVPGNATGTTMVLSQVSNVASWIPLQTAVQMATGSGATTVTVSFLNIEVGAPLKIRIYMNSFGNTGGGATGTGGFANNSVELFCPSVPGFGTPSWTVDLINQTQFNTDHVAGDSAYSTFATTGGGYVILFYCDSSGNVQYAYCTLTCNYTSTTITSIDFVVPAPVGGTNTTTAMIVEGGS